MKSIASASSPKYHVLMDAMENRTEYIISWKNLEVLLFLIS